MNKLLISLGILGIFWGIEISANQMFPAGGVNGISCPSGSSYKGSGFCQSLNNKQFFKAGGVNGTSCPSGSSYIGSGFCQSR